MPYRTKVEISCGDEGDDNVAYQASSMHKQKHGEVFTRLDVFENMYISLKRYVSKRLERENLGDEQWREWILHLVHRWY